MKKYLVLYKAPVSAAQRMAEVPQEQQAEGMKAWMEWAQKCGTHLLDLGQPLAGNISLMRSGGSENANSEVGGFSMLQAEDMEAARKLVEGHPHLMWDNACYIELHEAMPIPGM